MTPADIIVEARKLLQDTRVPYRYSDDDLLGYINHTVRRMLTLRPDLFTTIEEIPTAPANILQQLPAGSHRLVDIFSVVNHNSVNEVERLSMERAYPQWVSDPPGVPYNFMRHPRNPTQFFLYPKPIPGLQLLAEYTVVPELYELQDEMNPPGDAYMAAVIDGVVFLASSIDDEHVEQGRAALFQESFMQGLGLSLQSRVVTDREDGSVEPPPEERRRQRR